MEPGCSRDRLTDRAAIARAIEGSDPVSLLLVREGPLSATSTALVERARSVGIEVSVESEREMRRMSASDSAPELLAVGGPPLASDLDELMERGGLVLGLVGLRYPANVGFILRSAEVAGVAGVVVSNDWAGGEWEEAHRIGIRAHRFLSVLEASAASAVSAAQRAGRRVIAIETSGRAMPWEVDLSISAFFLIGGETTGIPAPVLAQADEVLRLPTRGFIPSYNVQAATGMLLGEWLRQTA